VTTASEEEVKCLDLLDMLIDLNIRRKATVLKLCIPIVSRTSYPSKTCEKRSSSSLSSAVFLFFVHHHKTWLFSSVDFLKSINCHKLLIQRCRMSIMTAEVDAVMELSQLQILESNTVFTLKSILTKSSV
jgi:hypothetical protein